MTIVAGVDIGNDNTEVCLAQISDEETNILASSVVKTTGIKGTVNNIKGVLDALNIALSKCGRQLKDVAVICVNEATPVIADLAMSTVAETIITESAMIGHNPQTPGGVGLGIGITILVDELADAKLGERYVAVIPKRVDFETAAKMINEALMRGVLVEGAIVQNDEAVLINNRISKVIPIVDEVKLIEKVPLHMLAAVEVALEGQVIQTLCNPYGIATIFGLDAEKTRMVAPMAISLIGNRSAVVIKTPEGSIKKRRIPAGRLQLVGPNYSTTVDINEGSKAIMDALSKFEELVDAVGEAGTSVGGMLWRVKHTMEEVSKQPSDQIRIRDLLAVDTLVPQKVKGGLADEYSLNKAVMLGAMVWTNKSVIKEVTEELQKKIGISVHIEGVEALMAALGARTTPGVSTPTALVDIGAGSTDVVWIDAEGNCNKYVHLAGAGDMITMIINSELNLNDLELAELVKRYPAGKVEGMYQLRLEDGTIKFFKEPAPPQAYGRVVILEGESMTPLPGMTSLERVRMVRRNAKKRVVVTNVLRGLTAVAPGGNLHTVQSVLFVGGSSLDFETPQLISEELLRVYGIISGCANVRGTEGPRNAVATGLVLSYAQRRKCNGE